jgi:hypothetical protein
MGKGEIEERAPVPLSPIQFRIYDIVRRSKYGIPGTALVDRVYAHRSDGGPINAYNSVQVQIKRANERLAKAGIRITSETHGEGGGYRLERFDV